METKYSGKTYTITCLNDLLSVPSDRMKDLLSELQDAVAMAVIYRELAIMATDILGDDAYQDGLTTQRKQEIEHELKNGDAFKLIEFIWTDDGLPGVDTDKFLHELGVRDDKDDSCT